MLIRKVPDLRTMTKDLTTIFLNVDKRSWIKLSQVAIKIIDSIDNLEYEEAVEKIQNENNVPRAQAEGFIEYMINTGTLERVQDLVHIKLIDSEKTGSNLITHCYLHVTNRCNLKCGYCSYDARNDINKELSTNLMKSIIRRVSLNKIQQLVFAGGEPLLRKDIQELILYAKKLIPDIGMVTNGTLITPENAEFLVKNVNKIQVSLDSGIQSVHDSIRGEGSFERTVEGIRLLRKYGHSQVKITPTVNRFNIDSIESIVHIAKELDVMLEARFFLPIGRGNCNKIDFSVEYSEMSEAFSRIWAECEKLNFDKYSIKHFYDSVMTAKTSCGVCKDKICVDVDGSIYPCAYLMDKGTKIGNIFDKLNIYEIIDNSEIGSQIAHFDVDNIKSCKQCQVRYFCAGGCMAVRYGNTGDINGAGIECTHYRKLLDKLVWESTDNTRESLLTAVGIRKE